MQPVGGHKLDDPYWAAWGVQNPSEVFGRDTCLVGKNCVCDQKSRFSGA